MKKTPSSIWKVETLLAKEIAPNVNEEMDYYFETHQEALDFYDDAVEDESFINVYLPKEVHISTFKDGKLQ